MRRSECAPATAAFPGTKCPLARRRSRSIQEIRCESRADSFPWWRGIGQRADRRRDPVRRCRAAAAYCRRSFRRRYHHYRNLFQQTHLQRRGRPGIRAPQELRGKKIGVLSVIGLNQIVVATALKHWGIDEKSVMLVRAGGSRDRFTALQNGLIDATVLTGAFVDRAKAAGMPVLLDLGDLEDCSRR